MASFRDVIIGTDGIPAIVTLTSNESYFTDATPFEIQIVFDYAVTGFVVGDISITNATLSNFAGSGTSYTADVTPDLTGDVSVSVARNVVNERNRPSNVVNIDDLSRAYVTVTSEVEDFTDATPFRIFVDFDKNVTGFVSGDITVVNGTLSSFGISSGSSYSAYVTPDLTGSVAVLVAENVVNEDNYASNNKIITYITAVANCTITSDESDFTDATPFEIQITFSGAVTGFVVGDITISNGTLSNFAGSGTNYTADVTPNLSGDISISVAENVTNEGNSASNTVTVTDNSQSTEWIDAPQADTTGAYSLTESNKRFTQSGSGYVTLKSNSYIDNSTVAKFFVEIKLGYTDRTIQTGLSWGTHVTIPNFSNRIIYRQRDNRFYLVRVGHSNQSLSVTWSEVLGDSILFFIEGNKAWVGYRHNGSVTIIGDPIAGTGEFTSDIPTNENIFISGTTDRDGYYCQIVTDSGNSGFPSWDSVCTYY